MEESPVQPWDTFNIGVLIWAEASTRTGKETPTMEVILDLFDLFTHVDSPFGPLNTSTMSVHHLWRGWVGYWKILLPSLGVIST